MSTATSAVRQRAQDTKIHVHGLESVGKNSITIAVSRDEDSTTGDAHSITIRNGSAVRCSCPAYQYHVGPEPDKDDECVHQAAVNAGHVDILETEEE